MRPSHRLAIAAAALIAGVVLVFASVRDPAPPAGPAPKPIRALDPVEPRADAEPDEDQERVLDQLEDREAEQLGEDEAARRRNYREQLLRQRPQPE